MIVVVIAFALLSLWGIQRAATLLALVRRDRSRRSVRVDDHVRTVTVQVPLYNEPNVAVRAVNAACALRWPALDVQILDDSDDGSSAAIADAVASWRDRGVDVVHVRRTTRAGFKAGALAHGLPIARGDFVAIFDADFVPPPDFLERAMPRFEHDDDVDMVQARWAHLNRDDNWLTRAQAALLDAHFFVEQRGRARAGLFFGFNGTAGIWRKNAIVDAGGWSSSTLTEDLDLSVRAWLRGSRFAYVDDVEVPAELPRDIAAWRVQQHRWAKGALETARLRLGDVWRASTISFVDKIDLTLKLTQNIAYAALFVVVAALPFVEHSWLGAVGALPAIAALLIASKGRVVDVVIAIGLCAAMSFFAGASAIAGALGIGDRTFHRTPKRGLAASGPTSSSSSSQRRFTAFRVVEIAVALTQLVAITHGSAFAVVVAFASGALALLPQEARDERRDHHDPGPRSLFPRAVVGRTEHGLVEQR